MILPLFLFYSFIVDVLFYLFIYNYYINSNLNLLYSNIQRICINNKHIFLNIFTSNIIEETMNFYYSSVIKFNITNAIFITLDYNNYYSLHKLLPNVFIADIKYNISEHIDYSTPLYWKIVYCKTDYVKLFLENNCNVILCDSDIIFFKDPREYIFRYETDLVTSCDHRCPVMNSGF